MEAEISRRFTKEITERIVTEIKPLYFTMEGDLPLPEEEIEAALQHNSGLVQLPKGRFLVIATAENGKLYVWQAQRCGRIYSSIDRADHCAVGNSYPMMNGADLRFHRPGDIAYYSEPNADGNFEITVLYKFEGLGIQGFLEGLARNCALS
jgi:hypothetical protein